jgi:hypothetical protein
MNEVPYKIKSRRHDAADAPKNQTGMEVCRPWHPAAEGFGIQ